MSFIKGALANNKVSGGGGIGLSLAHLPGLGHTWLRQYATVRKSRSNKTSSKPGSKNPLFQYGKFSRLSLPSRKEMDISQQNIENITSFESLKIFPSVRIAMMEEIRQSYNLRNTYIKSKDELDIKPTPVQVAAIKKINRSRNPNNKKGDKFKESRDIFNELMLNNLNNKLKIFTMAAETGSGKTWAYLSILLSKLKEDDLSLFNKHLKSYEQSRMLPMIRSVILLPTNELIDQVYETLQGANKIPLDFKTKLVNKKILSDNHYRHFLEHENSIGNIGYNVIKWGAGDAASKLFNNLHNKPIDVLITTPTKLQSLGKQHNTDNLNPFRFLYNVQYCVIDEADTLFDPSWVNDTTAILNKFSKCKDLILCSATIPKKFSKTVEHYFKDQTINVVTPALHKVPKQINLKIIDAELTPYNGSKTRALAQALYAIQRDGTEKGYVKRIIVFVNNKKDVLPLISVLTTKYHQDPENLIGISGLDSPIERSDKIKPFICSPQETTQENQIKVLITTDLFARGINFQGIKNVILMDFPNSSVDLVHRIGRTGRMKQSGRVFIITDKKSRKSWIKSLPNITKQGVRIG